MHTFKTVSVYSIPSGLSNVVLSIVKVKYIKLGQSPFVSLLNAQRRLKPQTQSVKAMCSSMNSPH